MIIPAPVTAASPADLPYSFERLDALMEAQGIDALVATSKHAVRYLLGGYAYIFFSAMDAIGKSRYLPAFVYLRGDAGRTGYFANKMESHEHAANPFWVPLFVPEFWGSIDTMTAVAAHLAGSSARRIGIEPSFLPKDGFDTLAAGVPGATFADASPMLAELRMVKTPAELALVRAATELTSAAMQATIAASGEGADKSAIIDRLRVEETTRGLHFEYCLLTLGASHVRARSPQRWQAGEVLSIDSGANLHGYVGDICRMGVQGEPDAELEDLLAEVDAVQQAAFAAVAPGRTGTEIVTAASEVLRQGPNAEVSDFFTHGMGLVAHEAPFLMTNHPVAYDGTDAETPLAPGMVLSIETTLLHPARGFIKLEDTVAVTADGCELFGADSRGWTRGG